jgi:hypothetical protein
MIYEVSMGARRENGALQERLDAFLREAALRVTGPPTGSDRLTVLRPEQNGCLKQPLVHWGLPSRRR